MHTFFKSYFFTLIVCLSYPSLAMEPADKKYQSTKISPENQHFINQIQIFKTANPQLNVRKLKEALVKKVPLTLDQAISLFEAAHAASFPFAAQFAAYAIVAQELPFWFPENQNKRENAHKLIFTEIDRQHYLLNKLGWRLMGFFFSLRELVDHGCLDPEYYSRHNQLEPLALNERLNSLDGLNALPKLQTFECNGGQITTIEESDTPGLTQLLTLQVNRHRLHAIPGIAMLTSLTGLNLSSNKLTNAALCLSGLQALTTLDLSYNRLTSLLPLKALTRLQSLDIAGNNLTALSEDEMQSHGQLTFLNAENNWNWDEQKRITTIDGVCLLTNLKRLLLRANGIAKIAPSISGLRALQHIELDENRLPTIPVFPHTTALKEITIQHNQITHLSADEIAQLAALPALEHLSLGGNYLSEENKARIKAGLPQVKRMTLSAYLKGEELPAKDN